MTPQGALAALALFDSTLATDRGLALTRAVLDGARAAPQHPTAAEPTREEISRFERRHRLMPLVATRFPTPDRHRAMLELTRSQLHLLATARRAHGWLQAAGIDARILKGTATAELDYHAPHLRQTGDVDLLVATRDYERAAQIIVENGGVPVARRGAPDTVLKGAAFTTHDGVEIDLHFRISRFAPTPPDEPLFETSTPLPVGGLVALGREGRLIHAAVHALDTAAPDRRLSSVADVVAIVDNRDLDWNQARDLADRLGVTGIAGEAFRAEALIMDRAPHPGCDWPPPSRLVRHTFMTNRRRLGSEHVLALTALPPGASRWDYIKGWLAPPTETAEVYGGRMRYGQRLLGKLVGRTR